MHVLAMVLSCYLLIQNLKYAVDAVKNLYEADF